MFEQKIVAAAAALLVSATLVGTAQAQYPSGARGAPGTVTGMYRPLNLSLGHVDQYAPRESTSRFFEYEGGGIGFSAIYCGSYSTTGYQSNVSGEAGCWIYELDSYADESYGGGYGLFFQTDTYEPERVIELQPFFAGAESGTFRYLGGGDFTGVNANDTPLANDIFKFYANTASVFLRATQNSETFDWSVSFNLDAGHAGPFIQVEGSELRLDDDEATGRSSFCSDRFPCTASLSTNLIPEPASLALVGLGLVALALGRRRQLRS